MFLAGDEPELAYEDILEVLKEDPKDFVATCVKAKCMFRMGDFEKSLVIWQNAKKIRANVVEVGQNEGSLYVEEFMSISGQRCHRKCWPNNQRLSSELLQFRGYKRDHKGKM